VWSWTNPWPIWPTTPCQFSHLGFGPRTQTQSPISSPFTQHKWFHWFTSILIIILCDRPCIQNTRSRSSYEQDWPKKCFQVDTIQTRGLGICWRNQFYVDTCLPFSLRSAPYLFNQLSIAIHWILQHSYGVQYLLHCLDDFFTGLAQQIHRSVKRICNQCSPCAGISMCPLSCPRLRALPLHWYSLVFTSTVRRWKPASQMNANVLY